MLCEPCAAAAVMHPSLCIAAVCALKMPLLKLHPPAATGTLTVTSQRRAAMRKTRGMTLPVTSSYSPAGTRTPTVMIDWNGDACVYQAATGGTMCDVDLGYL